MEPFEREVVSDLDEQTDDRAEARRRIPLHVRILLGLVVGAALGGAARAVLGPDAPALAWVVRHIAEPVGQLFLRSLLMTVVPLVVSSLIVGVAGIGDVRRLGRVGAAHGGVLPGHFARVGRSRASSSRTRCARACGSIPATRDLLMARVRRRVEAGGRRRRRRTSRPLMSFVRTLVPANPLESMARSTPDMIGIMFFSIVFGAALTLVSRESAAPVIALLDGVFKVDREGHRHRHEGRADRRRVPAVHDDGAVRVRVSRQPRLVCRDRARRARDSHVRRLSASRSSWPPRVSPVEFFRRVRTVMLTAFSTSSSNATLPTALRVSEANLGVPREIGAFVLTVGATANQNGTALYEGVTVLFLAQLAGVDLTLAQQLMIVYLAVLGSIGTAGVPSGSTPFVVAVLATIGINPRAHRDHPRRRSPARHVPDGRERGGGSDGGGVRGEEGRGDAEYLKLESKIYKLRSRLTSQILRCCYDSRTFCERRLG